MTAKHTEVRLEDHIVARLVESGGWRQGAPGDYDQQTRLIPSELWAFLEATQPDKVERLEVVFGAAYRRDVERLIAKDLDSRPARVLHVLRHGIELRSVKLDLAYFKPAHDLTPELAERYAANRLTVVRQLAYSPEHTNTLDVALFVNGLGVATSELKNSLSGQTVDNAKEQYRKDRDPRDPFLSRRCVVHFAADTDRVWMTTRLAGAKTHFLPFNRGASLDGRGGEGNPPAPAGGYATSYLWDQVWDRDAWLDILGRFIHVEPAEDPKAQPSIIFPRYHQWDAVLRLTGHARTNGAGNNYLVAHSAGSGKTNTIGWLAHRLASLHDANSEPVFHKVIVITDRKVLDKQLQTKIEQFERRNATGMVATIDKHSSQLADALRSPGAKIIVTTLQKFPHVLGDVDDLPDRRYAVIIDEAHSSQSGETSKKMKEVVAPRGASDEELLELAAEEDATYLSKTGEDDINTAVEASAAARGRQANLSMFAFTATPKAKTLELFGSKNGDVGEKGTGLFGPFHLYSMRQAIEEGYILDVLANYSTYKTYYRLSVAGEDLEVERSKAAIAAARYASLHPHALAQKAEIIVEHFRAHTAKAIGGKAKAMVVTRSRLHAVRYQLAIEAYIAKKGYTDIKALVAFSGEVIDPDLPGHPYTEPNMNGFPETQTAKKFNTDEYQVMVVAEKFQTGFDQPLLHTMFVDKKLDGVNAVQTLSRLNRTSQGKTSTFVLDFVNDAEDIQAAFAPYYETTLATETEPEHLYDGWRRIEDHLVVQDEDIERFARVWFALDNPEDTTQHAGLYTALKPCEDRFAALDEDAQDALRTSLIQFVRMYAFLAQVLTYTDTTMEKRYALCRMLSHRLRDQRVGTLDLGDDVEMTYLRIDAGDTLDASLKEGAGELTAFTGDGELRATQEELVLLSEVIDKLNERFSTDFTGADAVKFESLATQMSDDPIMQEQADANDLDHFTHAFDARFTAAVVDWMKDSEDLAVRLLDDPEFADIAKAALVKIVHRQAAQRHKGSSS